MEKTRPPLQFRFATADDAEALARVQTMAMNAVAKGGLPDPQRTFIAKHEKMKHILHGEQLDRTLIASLDNEPVGFIMYEKPEQDKIFVSRFYVSTPSQYVGSYLLEKVSKMHPEVKSMHLKANDESMPYYKKMGFIQTSDYDMQMTPDVLTQWRENMVYDRARAKKQTLDM